MSGSDASRKANRTRMATGLVLALVFVAGGLLGAAVSQWLVEPAYPSDAVAAAAPDEAEEVDDSEEVEGEERRRSLVHRVGLTPEQEIITDSILEIYEGRVDRLQEIYREGYWAAVDSTRDALRVFMDSAQLVRYDSLILVHDRRNQSPADSTAR